MRLIGITQRVDHYPEYSENRDCLDQRWASFIFKLGCLPIPLPNILPEQVVQFVEALRLDAVVLSGGNSIELFDSTASDVSPERDAFEMALLEYAVASHIPVLGVCRGMQMINVFLGGGIERLDGHVGHRHSLQPVGNNPQLPDDVNSFHHWGITSRSIAGDLKVLAYDSENNVEAFSDPGKQLLGIMWHPERDQPFNPVNLRLVKDFIG